MSDELPRQGSWYLNCPSCRADCHVVGHNRVAESDDPPQFCPFCGRTGVDVEPEPSENTREEVE